MIDSEEELIRQAQRAESDAFCALAARYERRIHSLAFHYCRASEDAEDLSQEVWLRAYQAIGTFRGESSFYTWLRRITINCFLNHRRAKSFVRRRFSGRPPRGVITRAWSGFRTFSRPSRISHLAGLVPGPPERP